MADEKGWSIEEAKARLPYSEFLSWLWFYRKKMVRRDKSEYYLAGLRMEVVALRLTVANLLSSKKLPTLHLDDYLLEHKDSSASAEKLVRAASGVLTPADGPKYVSASKAAWGAAIGLYG